MARQLALNVFSKKDVVRVAGILGLAISFSPVARAADAPMMQEAMSTNAAPAAPANPTAVTTPPPVPPPPPAPQDTFNRYGKIWAPSDDVSHPLKLNFQFPVIGEIKVPSQEELNQGDKLEQLANLSDADIRSQLEQWPPFSKMKLGDEAQLLSRIQAYKDQRTRIAQGKARDLGLTLTPDQQAKFEKEYWEKRRKMDRDIAKQFEPILKAREQKMKEELFRDFSTPGASGPPPPKPPTPPPAPAPTAQTNPSAPTTTAVKCPAPAVTAPTAAK